MDNAEKQAWFEEHGTLYNHEIEQARKLGYLEDKDFVLEMVKRDEYLASCDEQGRVVKVRVPYLEYASPKLQADREVVITAIMSNFDAFVSADFSLQEDEKICKLAALYKKSWEVRGNSAIAAYKRRKYAKAADKLGAQMLQEIQKNKNVEAQ